MKPKRKIKPLTYGMVTMSSERGKDVAYWRESCWEYSEKKDSVFWEIRGRCFCSFVEDGIPRIERVGKKAFPDGDQLFVVFLDIEEMVFRKPLKNYDNNKHGFEKAKEDFKNGMLTGMFLTDDVSLW